MLFWITLGMAILTFLLVIAISVFLARIILSYYKVIKNCLKQLLQDSLNPNLFLFVDLEPFEDKRNPESNLGKLIDVFVRSINEQKKDEEFCEAIRCRPKEEWRYSKWTEHSFPVNKWHTNPEMVTWLADIDRV
jgi:hypothetical protein